MHSLPASCCCQSVSTHQHFSWRTPLCSHSQLYNGCVKRKHADSINLLHQADRPTRALLTTSTMSRWGLNAVCSIVNVPGYQYEEAGCKRKRNEGKKANKQNNNCQLCGVRGQRSWSIRDRVSKGAYKHLGLSKQRRPKLTDRCWHLQGIDPLGRRRQRCVMEASLLEVSMSDRKWSDQSENLKSSKITRND